MQPDPATIADRPEWLPHRLDIPGDRIELVPTDRAAIRSTTFMDGRTDFAKGRPRIVPLATWLAGARPDGRARIIFHIGFCGSTLLSRLLDHPGKALIVREPQILADLSTYRADGDRRGADLADVGPIAETLSRALCRGWQADEAVAVKPTNWINNIAPDICASPATVPLFLVAARETFVKAVVRGGSDRIAFVARGAVHWSTRGRDNAELLAAALARDVDQPVKLASIVATAHEMQMRLLRSAAAARGCDAGQVLFFEDLLRDQQAAAERAATVLRLPIEATHIAQAVAAWSSRHAKAPETAYSIKRELAADAAAQAAGAGAIADALDWADRTIGPATAIVDRPARETSR